MTVLTRNDAFEFGFSSLNADILVDVAGLAVKATLKHIKTGETLYMEGDEAPFCYQVADGLIKEYNTLEDGRRQVADFYNVGELFGISETDKHLYTAEAITACTVRCYPRDAYLRTISSSPELSQQFLDTLMMRLHRARERMIMLGRMSAVRRVASFLLRLSSEQQTKRDIRIVMSRQDIADHLGLTIETVCRVLTNFKKQHVIKMKTSRRFDIPSISTLNDMIAGTHSLH